MKSITGIIKCEETQNDLHLAIEFLYVNGGLTLKELKSIYKTEFAVVRWKRGRASFKRGMWYVPKWVHERADKLWGFDVFDVIYRGHTLKSGFIYYVAHEMSHILSRANGHNDSFYKVLTRILPERFQKYELGYKTKTASKWIKSARFNY